MTQTEILHIKLDSQIDTDECLDAINTSDRYIISDIMKMSVVAALIQMMIN